MAEKLYKVNEAIELGYQAPNKQSGLSGVVAEIYLPNKEKDSSFPDVTLVEVGNSGTYRGEFTPDQQGTWQVIMHKDDGDGQVTKNYSVGGYNVHSVGEAIDDIDSDVASLDTKVDTRADTTDGKVDDLDSDVAAVDGKVDAVDAKADTTHTKIDTVEGKIDDISNSVGALDTPPMAF